MAEIAAPVTLMLLFAANVSSLAIAVSQDSGTVHNVVQNFTASPSDFSPIALRCDRQHASARSMAGMRVTRPASEAADLAGSPTAIRFTMP